MWNLIIFLVVVDVLTVESSDKPIVEALLYDTVRLPCSLPFIQRPEGLSVVWVKEDKDGNTLIVLKIIDGKENLADQNINYTNRTELSGEFSQGNADLIIRGVTFSDEGTYTCRVVNGRGHGDKEVELTIGGLNADDVRATSVHIDGKDRLKSFCTGVFVDPMVKWHDIDGNDLSEYGAHTITDLGDGRKMVESVLDLDVETNKQYFCHVQEGRLKRTARAVISDGKPVTVSECKIPG